MKLHLDIGDGFVLCKDPATILRPSSWAMTTNRERVTCLRCRRLLLLDIEREDSARLDAVERKQRRPYPPESGRAVPARRGAP